MIKLSFFNQRLPHQKNLLKHDFKNHLNNKGQGLIEYLMLVALIAVATMGVVKVVGKNVAVQYENINRALGARTNTPLDPRNASDAALRQKDLSNFMDGVRSSNSND